MQSTIYCSMPLVKKYYLYAIHDKYEHFQYILSKIVVSTNKNKHCHTWSICRFPCLLFIFISLCFLLILCLSAWRSILSTFSNFDFNLSISMPPTSDFLKLFISTGFKWLASSSSDSTSFTGPFTSTAFWRNEEVIILPSLTGSNVKRRKFYWSIQRKFLLVTAWHAMQDYIRNNLVNRPFQRDLGRRDIFLANGRHLE